VNNVHKCWRQWERGKNAAWGKLLADSHPHSRVNHLRKCSKSKLGRKPGTVLCCTGYSARGEGKGRRSEREGLGSSVPTDPRLPRCPYLNSTTFKKNPGNRNAKAQERATPVGGGRPGVQDHPAGAPAAVLLCPDPDPAPHLHQRAPPNCRRWRGGGQRELLWVTNGLSGRRHNLRPRR